MRTIFVNGKGKQTKTILYLVQEQNHSRCTFRDIGTLGIGFSAAYRRLQLSIAS